MRWLLSLFALVALSACHATPPAQTHGQVNKLVVLDHKIGTGAEAKPGMIGGVQYTGWLDDDQAKEKQIGRGQV